MVILDTDILVDVLRGYPAAAVWFCSLTEIPLVAGFSTMELIQGAKNGRDLEGILLLIAPLRLVWPSADDCDRAMRVFANLRLSHGLGLLDSLIATCAIGHGADLCTFNSKHYAPIPGLTTISPYTR